MNGTLEPAREIFRQFPAILVVAFYFVAIGSIGTFAYGVWARVRKYRAGRPAGRVDRIWERVAAAVRGVAGTSRIGKRDALAGWAHALILWGFAVLFAGTLIVALDHDIIRPLAPDLRFFRGGFYLWASLVLDLLGAALLLGLLVMVLRRFGLRPAQLDYSRADSAPGESGRRAYVLDDHVFLWGLIAIVATGFLVEGLRIAADRPAFEIWSVVGWQVAGALDALGLSRSAASDLHPYLWWAHAVLALAFVAYIPYSKAVHILVGAANLVFRDPLAGKRIPGVPADAAGAGYAGLTDFTWKELLDLDACTKCGRCHAACPARAGGWPLSPRDLILDLRERAEAELGGRGWFRAGARAAGGPGPGDLIPARTLWSCTTCLACVEACPVGVEHVPIVVQLRRRLVENGAMDANLQKVLERLATYGNSFGEPDAGRPGWLRELPFAVKDARTEPVDMLWFVGDYASYHPEMRGITRSVAAVFHRAGLDFGVLHDGECNSGNDIRRVGEEGLYQMLVERNLAALSGARFNEIVTTDPHSYNTLRHEYPEFGAQYRVRHYSEVLSDLIASGRLPIARRLDAVVTFHDPCHLSRYAGLTEAPREVLRALGLTLVEMPRNRANSFCCGAGGGRIWMTDAGAAERPSQQRIREALELPGVTVFAVACPKDLTMYRDAAKSAGAEGRLRVVDLIELVGEALAAG